MAVSPETTNELMVVFSNTVSAGFNALQGAVNGVFGLMIVLVVALTAIQWLLSPNREILASGFGKILLIGFFAYVINDWHALSETLYAGFIELGLTAGGGSLSQGEFLNPGAILQQGWEIVKALGETPAPVNNPLDVAGNLTDALILGLAMIGIMLAFGVLALQIIVTLLEFKIVTLGGFRRLIGGRCIARSDSVGRHRLILNRVAFSHDIDAGVETRDHIEIGPLRRARRQDTGRREAHRRRSQPRHIWQRRLAAAARERAEDGAAGQQEAAGGQAQEASGVHDTSSIFSPRGFFISSASVRGGCRVVVIRARQRSVPAA